jgi:hypothetical protein
MFGSSIVGDLWPRVQEARLVATEAPGEWHLDGRRLAVVESPLDSAGGRILLMHDVTAAHDLKAELDVISGWWPWARWRLRWHTSCEPRWQRHCSIAPISVKPISPMRRASVLPARRRHNCNASSA